MLACWMLIIPFALTTSPAPMTRELGAFRTQDRCEAALANARAYRHAHPPEGYTDDWHLPHPEAARQPICICRERAG